MFSNTLITIKSKKIIPFGDKEHEIDGEDKEFFMETLKVQTSFWMRTGLLCDVTCNK